MSPRDNENLFPPSAEHERAPYECRFSFFNFFFSIFESRFSCRQSSLGSCLALNADS